METVDVIVQVVSTVGFPVAMSIMLLWFLKTEQENHKAEMNGLKDVIAENNEVLISLKQLLQDKLKGE